LVARTMTRSSDGQVSLAQVVASHLSSRTSDDSIDPIAIDYSHANGWYVTFPAAGMGDAHGRSEMVVSTPFYAAGAMFFSTVWVAVGRCADCGAAIKSTFYSLDPLKGLASGILGGGAAGLSTLDQRLVLSADSTAFGDTKVTAHAAPASTSPTTTAEPRCHSVAEQKASVFGAQDRLVVCVPASQARIQWREIRGLRTQ
jgi:hypothetical protein